MFTYYTCICVYKDLDEDEVGGAVTWSPPVSLAETSEYVVYLATSDAGAGKSLVGDLAVGTNRLDAAADTAMGSFTHVVVYTKSSLFEQTTPEPAGLVDTVASVSNMAFTDGDLDTAELEGTLSWSHAADVTHVTHYVAYLSPSNPPSHAGKSQIAEVAVAESETSLPTDHPQSAFIHFLVFTKSTLAQQTTPVALAIVDVAATAKGLGFVDLDLDADELGGLVVWNGIEGDGLQVVSYNLYLAESAAAGATRTSIGADVAAGTNQIALAEDTAEGSWTHVAIHTVSSLSERTAPTFRNMSLLVSFRRRHLYITFI